MYKKLLVPLDGSELSECSLQHVKAIAAGCKIIDVILLSVIEPLSIDTVAALATHGGNLLARAEQDSLATAQNYLLKVHTELKNEGINSETAVVAGRAAEEILKYEKCNHIDLIVMSTHGRSGASRWVWGSVADKVVSHSTVPVLIISPHSCRNI